MVRVRLKSSKLLIIVPTLFLTAFLGLFVATEYRRLLTDKEIRTILAAPLSDQMERVQKTMKDFQGIVFLRLSPDQDREVLTTALWNTYEALEKEAAVLAGLFLNQALEATENLVGSDILTSLKINLQKVGQILPQKGAAYNEEHLYELREITNQLTHDVHELSLSIDKAHKKEIGHILNHIFSFDKQRSIISVLVLLSGIALVIVLLRNVSRSQSIAQRALAAERYNALFAAALQSTRVGVLIRDMKAQGTPVVFINDSFARMTGYALAEIQAGSSDFLFGWNTDQAAITAFRRAVSLRETATFEVLIYRKDGSPFWSEWHLSPVIDGNGNLTHFVSLFTDVSTFRQTQEDLIQAKTLAQNASAVKTNFLAMMSHEIRTPINGIMGVLKLVEETPLDSEQKHLVNIAKTSSKALHTIINDILDYAKMEAGKIEIYEEAFSLTEVLDGILGLFQEQVREKGVELLVERSPEIPDQLIGDIGRIRQIILNLVSNAIKFTDKGFVRLRILSLMSQDVEGKPGLLVRFEVQDSGIGISPADQEKLFKEFSQIERSFTRRFGGTGLGLAISRRLVELLHGEIGVESQPGKGSKFWFMIPILVGEQVGSATLEKGSAARGEIDEKRLYHILLVEDNDTNRLVARRYLEKGGFLVEEAVNGLVAIEKAKAAEFDLILMDVSMPEMDGMLATCHIRAQGGKNASVPVIALTAHVMAGDRELCLAAGMNDYLHKPLDYDLLIKSVSRWLNMKGAEPVSYEDDSPILSFQGGQQKGEASDYSAVPDFEPKILERMQKDLGGSVVRQVTQTYLDDSARRVLLFSAANRETIMETAHTLKSCSANCGMIRFSRLMSDLEQAANQNDNQRLEALMPLISEFYTVGRACLEEEKGKYSS